MSAGKSFTRITKLAAYPLHHMPGLRHDLDKTKREIDYLVRWKEHSNARSRPRGFFFAWSFCLAFALPSIRLRPMPAWRCDFGLLRMKDYIPELSEIRMVQRAPEGPLPFADADRSYVFSCLADVESSFGLCGFPGIAPEAIASRALIRQLIEWWRTLEPVTESQCDAYGRLPGAIRLIDTVSIWVEEQAARRKAKSSGV